MPDLSTSSEAPRLAVIGGGISGLTAAYRLRQLLPHARIELLEASTRLGGMLSTRRDDGLLIEYGADSFLTKLPAAVDLCRELGLDREIIPTNLAPRRALVLRDGKLHPVPSGFVQMRPEQYRTMLSSPLLSWRGKLRLLAERWRSCPAKIHDVDFDESVASFATRRLGPEVFQRLVQPLLAGIYTADPYQLSVAATMPTAIAAERQYGSLRRAVLAERKLAAASASSNTTSNTASKTSSNTLPGGGARYGSFVTLREGLGHLIETLTDRLSNVSVRLNCPVERVTPTSDHNWVVSLSDGSELPPISGVIVALPAPQAGRLLAAADAELSDALQTIPYASSAVVCLVYDRDQISDSLDGFGIVVPTIESREIIAASFSSIKFPGRTPTDQVLIRVFVGGALQPELLERSDADILKLAQTEMSQLLGIVGRPRRAELVRWQQKMPQYHVGHVQLVDRIEYRVAKHAGLELAGNAYRGVGIPQCVLSGDSAARRLASQHLSTG